MIDALLQVKKFARMTTKVVFFVVFHFFATSTYSSFA